MASGRSMSRGRQVSRGLASPQAIGQGGVVRLRSFALADLERGFVMVWNSVSLPVQWKDGEKVEIAAIGERLLDAMAVLCEIDQELDLVHRPLCRRLRKVRRLVDVAGNELVEALSATVEVSDE